MPEHPKDSRDLLKLFGVEHLATLKTLVSETKKDVYNKTPNEAAEDIRKLLDEMTLRVVSRDIDGCIACLNAIQLRVDMMQHVANVIKKGGR
jgi:hypothetical protein